MTTRAAPSSPSDLEKGALRDVLKRTVAEFREDNLTDWAAALTYYGVLSIFPALLVFVSIVGVIGAPVTEPLLDNIGAIAPSMPLRIGLTLVLLILLAASALLVVLTGPLAERAGEVIGVSGAVVTAWDIRKWLLLVLLISVMLALLYYAAPNVRQPGFRWITPGSILAVIVWIAASASFALYVAAFGSYNKTYGSLGAVIVFLIWLWLTNVAVLLGAELNAELERRRQVEGGHPPDREPFLPPRDEPS